MLHTIMHHPVLTFLRKKCSMDVGFLVLRVIVGAVFVYHGHMKLFGDMSKVVGFFNGLGIPAPEFFAPFVAGLEFFGGLLLILGLATRVLGLAFAINMTVAATTTFKISPTWGKHELELLLLAGGLLFLLAGPGAYSLDGLLMKRSQKEHEDALPAKP